MTVEASYIIALIIFLGLSVAGLITYIKSLFNDVKALLTEDP